MAGFKIDMQSTLCERCGTVIYKHSDGTWLHIYVYDEESHPARPKLA